MSVHKQEPFQIRLLLPKEMVSELDSIAASRRISRLALIRRFLQLQIDDEFNQLETYFAEAERRNKTHARLQEHLKNSEY